MKGRLEKQGRVEKKDSKVKIKGFPIAGSLRGPTEKERPTTAGPRSQRGEWRATDGDVGRRHGLGAPGSRGTPVARPKPPRQG